MEIEVSFPGGKRVDATFGGFTIRTDQPVSAGGQGSAPEPFALFLASLATCAGIYVVGFCKARNIPTEGIRLIERTENDSDGKRLKRVAIEVVLPTDFPQQYRDQVARAAAACKVKKTMFDPPEFEVFSSVEAEQKAAS